MAGEIDTDITRLIQRAGWRMIVASLLLVGPNVAAAQALVSSPSDAWLPEFQTHRAQATSLATLRALPESEASTVAEVVDAPAPLTPSNNMPQTKDRSAVGASDDALPERVKTLPKLDVLTAAESERIASVDAEADTAPAESTTSEPAVIAADEVAAPQELAQVAPITPNTVTPLPNSAPPPSPPIDVNVRPPRDPLESMKEITQDAPLTNNSLNAVQRAQLGTVPVNDSPAPTYTDASFVRSLSGADDVLSLDIIDPGLQPDMYGPTTLSEAVAFALKNNFESQAADARTDGFYWDKIGAYSQYAPSVEINASVGKETSEPATYNDAAGNRVLKDRHTRRDNTFAIRQPLIDLSIISDILTMRSKEDVAAAEELDIREGLALDTVNVYLRLLQARIAIQLADQYKGYLDELAQRMEARVEGGGATSGDLERIKGRATVAESARIEALGDYQSNLAEFKRLTQITPAQLQIPEVLAPVIPGEVDKAIDEASANNPAYLASLERVETAAYSQDKSYANLAPKVSLEYSKAHTYNAGGSAKGNPLDGVYADQDDQRLLVVAKWSIGGPNITAARSGAAKKREAEFRSMDVRERLTQSIRTTYNAIHAAEQRNRVLREGIGSYEKVVTEFEYQYENGNRSVFELLDAYEQLYSAKLNLLRLSIAKAQASYLVRREMGDLVDAILRPGEGAHG